jgi:hypothetical protein
MRTVVVLEIFRVWLVICMFVFTSASISSCNETPSVIESTAKVDDSCASCSYCHTGTLSDCQCGECMNTAYNADNKTLLVCSTRGMWQKERDCPGGGRVWCENEKKLHISCKDETGKEWY